MTDRFSTAFKNEALDGVSLNTIKLHSGDAGSSGTSNTISGASASCSYAPASNGERDLADVVAITVPAGETVSHYSVWSGSTFKFGGAFDSSPETYANEGTANISSARIYI